MSQTARGCVFFYGHRKGEHAAFSQFYGPIEFADEDGNTYNCAEQYMMAAKARVMGDTKTLAQILACDYNPTAIKQLGRRVTPYSEEKWVAARLECVCGARGVVLKGDEPEDGIVQCPGLPGKPCERSYCIKCGAHAHPGKPCEDVDEDDDVLKALGSDTKRCPACGNGITKVGGCNHVLCAPPGGCGKSFCFICL